MYRKWPVNIWAIGSSGKLSYVALAAAALALIASAAPAAGEAPPQLLDASLSQAGRRLILTVRTSKPVALKRLERRPGASGSRFLCLELRRQGRSGSRLLCLGGEQNAHRRAGLELRDAQGEVTDEKTIAVRLKRPDPDEIVLALLPSDAGLLPHRYRWRVVVAPGCRRATRCEESLPSRGERLFRLRAVRAVGCSGSGAGLVSNGPRERKVVALTFDDGPSDYTPAFLDVLSREHARGTFFEIGQEIGGRESTLRRILREGDEIGNHTTHHTEYPGYGSIAPTTALIESATHFRPCLFRPPGGAVDSSTIAAAAADGMRTVTWDVDPADWSNPGSAAVYGRIVGAVRPGSIVLMHDGGGDRSGTLAALPRIIDTLRARGYRFVTVTELLGERMLYRPYG